MLNNCGNSNLVSSDE